MARPPLADRGSNAETEAHCRKGLIQRRYADPATLDQVTEEREGRGHRRGARYPRRHQILQLVGELAFGGGNGDRRRGLAGLRPRCGAGLRRTSYARRRVVGGRAGSSSELGQPDIIRFRRT